MHLEPNTFYYTLLSTVCYLVSCQQAVISLYHEQKQELSIAALWDCVDHATSYVKNMAYPASMKTMNSHATSEEEPVPLHATNSLAALAATHRHILLHGPVAGEDATPGELCAPLIAGDILYGVLTLKRSQPFSRREVWLVRNISTIVATALESRALVRQMNFTQEQFHIEQTARANFLSMITHELRSPLNSINGYLDLVLSGVGGDLTSQQMEFIHRARAGSEHLYALLEDLLLISRADSGQLRLNREIITLSDVVTRAVEELELMAADQNITIHVELPGKLPHLYADALRLQQVLRNLINNALCFTPDGGKITISACAEHTEVGNAGGEQEAVIKLQVQDTGIGIPVEFQERIFERFFQVPSAAARRSGGQGLGLAIVRMILELHGGSVTVESLPEEGSTFLCTIPGVLS